MDIYRALYNLFQKLEETSSNEEIAASGIAHAVAISLPVLTADSGA